MAMKKLILLLILILSSASYAQQIAPVASHDSTFQRRPLPPSMLEELRRNQKARTIVFQDTLRSDDLTKMHFNDSAERTYSDSAISLYDTAVSLPHQEWLDSELFEIPELARFGSHVHFNYPPEIMTETYQQAVEFDSTLLKRMNPVTREHLPFFDQSPMPMPLEWPKKNESFIQAGAGNVDLPQLEGWFSKSLSDRITVDGFGDYKSLSSSASAIHEYANILANFNAQLGVDPSIQAFHSQELNVSAGYNSKSVAQGNNTEIDKTITQYGGSAAYSGDATEKFHYSASIAEHEFSDNANDGNESNLAAMLSARYSFDNYRIIGECGYTRASLNLDTTGTGNFFGTSSSILPISSEYAKVLFGEQMKNVEWFGGVEYLGGDGSGAVSYSSVMPIVRVHVELDKNWSIGGNFEPQVRLASLHEITNQNPFYSTGAILTEKQRGISLQPAIDARSVMMDKVNLAAYAQYFVSNDDEIRFEARYIERSRDVVFNTAIADSQTVFTAIPEDTRTISAIASGNFLFFAKDMLSASIEYASVTTSDGNAVPFVPNFKLNATYSLNSLWDNIRPSITFRLLSRPDETFSFMDANVNVKITHSLDAILSAENILGSASDFWPGYPECPRSIIASLKYSF